MQQSNLCVGGTDSRCANCNAENMAYPVVGDSLRLLELPDEMLVHILSYLSLDDLVTARLVSCYRYPGKAVWCRVSISIGA